MGFLQNLKTYIFLLGILLISTSNLVAQPKSLVKWMSLEEAVALQEKQPKTILIDAYTDWCGWCKVMDTTTFADPNIAGYINNMFYPVKFNAETTDTIVYRGKTYVNDQGGRRPPHQLAVELLKGNMSYPTLVYIDDQFNNFPVGGYLKPEQIEPILIYFAEKVNKTAPYDDFKAGFDAIYREKQSIPDPINWISFDDAIKKAQTHPKKILISIYSNYVISSNVFNKVILTDSLIAKYINDTYYPVQILAERTDTIQIGDRTFINELKFPNYPHQLPIALMNGEMYYPSLVFMDDKTMIINKITGFIKEDEIEMILNYFGSDEYTTKSWDEFRKSFESLRQ
jgi:thioredoxin-related protein